MIFMSLHLCPKCQGRLVWDSVKHLLTCLCGSTYSSFVNMANFKETTLLAKQPKICEDCPATDNCPVENAGKKKDERCQWKNTFKEAGITKSDFESQTTILEVS